MTDLTVTTPYRKAGGRVIVRSATDPSVFLLPFTFVPAASYTTNGNTIATADMPTGYTTMISPYAINCEGGYVWKINVSGKLLLAYVGESSGVGTQADSTANLQTSAGSSAITIFFLCC